MTGEMVGTAAECTIPPNDALNPVALNLNCTGMYRGLIRKDGVPMTAIFNDDVLE